MSITDPQPVRFSKKARNLAEALASVDRTLTQFALKVVDFESQTSGNDNADTIEDNANVEGMPIHTKGDIAALKYVFEQLKACLDIDDRRAVINRFVANSTPIF